MSSQQARCSAAYSASAWSAFPVCLPVWSSQAPRRYGEAEKEEKPEPGLGSDGQNVGKFNPKTGRWGARGGGGGTRPFSAACAHPERRMAMP